MVVFWTKFVLFQLQDPVVALFPYLANLTLTVGADFSPSDFRLHWLFTCFSEKINKEINVSWKQTDCKNNECQNKNILKCFTPI